MTYETDTKDPIDLVKKIAREFGISEGTKRLAVRCLRKAREAKLYSGKRRSSLAVALYMQAES